MFLHFRTNTRAPSVRRSIADTLEQLVDHEPGHSGYMGSVPYWMRNGYGLAGWPINNRMSRDEVIDTLADRWSVPLFTMLVPDTGLPWRSYATERNAWIQEEWDALGLPGAPPIEMRERQNWKRKQVRLSWVIRMVRPDDPYAGLAPLVRLEPTSWADPDADRFIGNLRVMLRRDFNDTNTNQGGNT